MCIKSILDTDLYKFTTSYAYMKLFPHAEGTFTFNDRDNTEYDEKFIEMLRLELSNLFFVYMCQKTSFLPHPTKNQLAVARSRHSLRELTKLELIVRLRE